MSNIKANTISAADLATLLMLSGERVRVLANEGVLQRVGRGEYAQIQSIQGYFHYCRQLAYGREAATIIDEAYKEICHLEARVRKLEGKPEA